MLQQYRIDYDDKIDVVIEIDNEKVTNKDLHEINNFWSGSDDRVDEEDGSVLNAVLKMLANVIFSNQLYYGFGTSGSIRKFDWDKEGVEGWPKMDGSMGFKIISVDDADFDTDYMNVVAI